MLLPVKKHAEIKLFFAWNCVILA